MIYDFLGKKLKSVIQSQSVTDEQYELYVHEIILPLIKYYLLDEYPYLKSNEKFISLYKTVRDDARIYKNLVHGAEIRGGRHG